MFHLWIQEYNIRIYAWILWWLLHIETCIITWYINDVIFILYSLIEKKNMYFHQNKSMDQSNHCISKDYSHCYFHNWWKCDGNLKLILWISSSNLDLFMYGNVLSLNSNRKFNHFSWTKVYIFLRSEISKVLINWEGKVYISE